MRRFSFACAVAAVALIAPPSASAINTVSFSQVGNMTAMRAGPGAARLPDGRVLVVGGDDVPPLNSAEIFDPATNTFSALGARMNSGRFSPAAASLPDGRILIAGGYNGSEDTPTAEAFNPSTGTFSPVGSMSVGRELAAAAPLADGRVLVAGGFAQTNPTATTEIFDPKTNTFGPGPSLPTARYGMAGAAISGGRVLVAGGQEEINFLDSAVVFNPSTNAFSPVGSLPSNTARAAGASLPQGRALVAGGEFDGGPGVGAQDLTRALIFDPATNSFSSAGIGNLIGKRREAAAVELRDGRVLVAGGKGEDAELNTAELLSVPSNAFKAKLKGGKVIFTVTNEGVASVTDVSNKPATTAKKKKPRLVKTKSKQGGPGKIKVKVKLTKAGSARLEQKGKLKIRVTYTPDRGLAATKKLKLRAGK
jgi:Kelch motif protein